MFEIRPAKESDWGQIDHLFQAAGKAAWAHLMSPEALDNLRAPLLWQELVREGRALVAAWEDKVMGFAAWRPNVDPEPIPHAAELASFYTHPRVWGQGAGRLLMKAILHEITRARFSQATLWTEERNFRPRAFYEAYGWVADGSKREREVRGTPLCELRYRFALAGDAV